MWIRGAALSIVLALAAHAARAAESDDELAQRHFDRGAALAAEQKYDEAAREFRASYEARARKESLFAWAQVARLGGDCSSAIELYQRFLRSPELTPTQIEAAHLGVQRCEAAPKTLAPPVAPPPPALPPPISAPTIVAAPAPVAIPPRSRASVTAGAILLGGAVVALGSSGTMFLLARGDERAAAAAGTWGDYHGAAARARDRQRWGFGLLGAGTLLGGGALVEWLATAPARGPQVTAWIGGGAGVGLRGSY